MAKPIITFENVGKSYKLGLRQQAYSSFREALVGVLKSPVKNLRSLSEKAGQDEIFWALRNISFDVPRGQVLGIVGSNGAGKSTLLKILSRITEPSEGRALLRGKVASLLEVGTGFHPELTGRENVYLNGSILGMKHSEIRRKFDEIVAFAEVEKFLDTPVKRYSSGMYVRLAFAVAAHLEPDILVVDEVLAVGDAEFQRKCLGKMQDVASGEGRTVLFVSHNMSAVQKLCSRAILLRRGQLVADGASEEVVQQYLAMLSQGAANALIEDNPERGGSGPVRLTGARILDKQDNPVQKIIAGEPMTIELQYRNTASVSRANVHLYVYNHLGTAVTDLDSGICSFAIKNLGPSGTICCRIPRAPFPIGHYRIGVSLDADSHCADAMPSLLAFDVETSVFFPEPRTPAVNVCAMMIDQQWAHETDRPADDSGEMQPGAGQKVLVS